MKSETESEKEEVEHHKVANLGSVVTSESEKSSSFSYYKSKSEKWEGKILTTNAGMKIAKHDSGVPCKKKE